MSLKKELLSRLGLEQLKEFAEKKGISFALNDTQKQYYADWSEKERLVDLMNDNKEISIEEIENHIKSYNNK
jgi:hypothetical protein